MAIANGQQPAEQNSLVFSTWLKSCTDEDFKQIVYRGNLSRTEIAKQCQFGLSVLNQNPCIKEAPAELEKILRQRGVLPVTAGSEAGDQSALPMIRQASGAGRSFEIERLRRLEQENVFVCALN